MSYKLWSRYSFSSLASQSEDPIGRLFLSGLGQVDLSGVTFLHEGVDTVRQIYQGVLKSDLLAEIQSAYDLGPSNRLFSFMGRRWILGSGGKSGYRFRLQNNEIGIILFIGSRYVDLASVGSHFKIDLSPHFIDSRRASHIQGYMDTLSSRLLVCPKPAGCSVHLCVDVQGWTPPEDFFDLLVTRSRRRINHVGVGSVEFDLNEIASVYGNAQSYLFGSASGLQFSLYRKDLQAQAVDKIHFSQDVWNRRTDENFKPLYQSGQSVWRFEFRYHHSVVNDFSEFVGERMSTFSDLVPHLTGLFRYALGNFRLNSFSSAASRKSMSYRGVYIDPMWQLLLQDVVILAPDSGFFYRRPKKRPGVGGVKNVLLAVGNLLSIYARNGFDPVQSFDFLVKSGIFNDYAEYVRSRYRLPNMQAVQSKIFEKITVGLEIRLLLGAFA